MVDLIEIEFDVEVEFDKSEFGMFTRICCALERLGIKIDEVCRSSRCNTPITNIVEFKVICNENILKKGLAKVNKIVGVKSVTLLCTN